jgi:hypothetical protein
MEEAAYSAASVKASDVTLSRRSAAKGLKMRNSSIQPF